MKFANTISAIAILAMSAASVTTLPVRAEDMKTLRVGILGGENEADRLRNWACVQEPLKKLTGMDVKLFPAADYDGVVQGLLGGTLDYADLGASGYAKIVIKDPKAVEVLAVQQQTDGSFGYYSVMIARKDSGIAKIDDTKGKSIAFADKDSTSGYLIPLTQLPKAVGGDIKTFFKSTGFAGGHEQVVQGVLDKKFDAGTTWASGVGKWEDGYTSGQLQKMVAKGTLNMKDIVEVWRSGLIPNGPSVIRSALPADLKAKIKGFLQGLNTADNKCFQAIEGGDYKGLVDMPSADFYDGIIAARKAAIGG